MTKQKTAEPSIDAPFKAEGERMREEVDRLGGVTKLGAELKVSPQLFYRYFAGKSQLGRALGIKMMEVGVDVNYIRTGTRGDAYGLDAAAVALATDTLRALDLAEDHAKMTLERIRQAKQSLNKKP